MVSLTAPTFISHVRAFCQENPIGSQKGLALSGPKQTGLQCSREIDQGLQAPLCFFALIQQQKAAFLSVFLHSSFVSQVSRVIYQSCSMVRLIFDTANNVSKFKG